MDNELIVDTLKKSIEMWEWIDEQFDYKEDLHIRRDRMVELKKYYCEVILQKELACYCHLCETFSCCAQCPVKNWNTKGKFAPICISENSAYAMGLPKDVLEVLRNTLNAYITSENADDIKPYLCSI